MRLLLKLTHPQQKQQCLNNLQKAQKLKIFRCRRQLKNMVMFMS